MIKKGFSQMKNEITLVFLGKKDEVYTTSEIIAEHAQVQHHAVQQLISVYENDFKEFGVIAFEMRKPPAGSKGGRPETIYHLNEQQATLLMTYLRNNDVVRAFKKELVRQFYAMREIIWKQQYERQTETWQAARIEGKKTRRLETDAIKLFVEYAKAQGSKNPDKYYGNFTKLANKVAGILPGSRDLATTAQLFDLRVIENVIDKAIMNEIADCTEYHKAYQNVKIKVLQVAALAISSGLEISA